MFKPGKWENANDVLKFKATIGNTDKAAANLSNKKANKRKKPKAKKPIGPLAPTNPKLLSNSKAKVQEGRVEKLSKKKKKKGKLTEKVSPAKKNLITKSIVSNGDSDAIDETAKQNEVTTKTSGSLKERLQEQLMGGRFRFINEQLYTMDSSSANQLFREDQDAFDAYHAGYRHQLEKWPMNPLTRIIKNIRRLPKALVIGDFGCGDGKLAKSVVHKVYSMDLVSRRPDILACDMAKTPLDSQSLDVAVYCLSLMGTNLKDYLLEANRVLKMNGIVFIAEIQSRFDEIHHFVRFMDTCGFELIKKDVNSKVFYFFEFKKVRNVGKVAIIQNLELKPCLYRKR